MTIKSDVRSLHIKNRAFNIGDTIESVRNCIGCSVGDLYKIVGFEHRNGEIMVAIKGIDRSTDVKLLYNIDTFGKTFELVSKIKTEEFEITEDFIYKRLNLKGLRGRILTMVRGDCFFEVEKDVGGGSAEGLGKQGHCVAIPTKIIRSVKNEVVAKKEQEAKSVFTMRGLEVQAEYEPMEHTLGQVSNVYRTGRTGYVCTPVEQLTTYLGQPDTTCNNGSVIANNSDINTHDTTYYSDNTYYTSKAIDARINVQEQNSTIDPPDGAIAEVQHSPEKVRHITRNNIFSEFTTTIELED